MDVHRCRNLFQIIVKSRKFGCMVTSWSSSRCSGANAYKSWCVVHRATNGLSQPGQGFPRKLGTRLFLEFPQVVCECVSYKFSGSWSSECSLRMSFMKGPDFTQSTNFSLSNIFLPLSHAQTPKHTRKK